MRRLRDLNERVDVPPGSVGDAVRIRHGAPRSGDVGTIVKTHPSGEHFVVKFDDGYQKVYPHADIILTGDRGR